MQVLDRTGVGTLWSICKTKFALKDHSHNYLPLSGGTLTGDLLFSNSGTTFRQIRGTCGDNDFWRIGGGATGNNAGYMEIATADDGTEPIYVRQYSGTFSTITRTATLLDSSGNTSFPGTVAAAKFKGALEGNASTATNAGNADTVDGYHASSLWRSDGGIWNPSANISLTASGNNQEWSFDIRRNGYTGCYWHVWDSDLSTLLKVNADNGKVYAPYNFVGNLEGNASTASNASTVNGHTVNANVPSNAKFTDTNTWRGIQDNLTSTSTSESLSANLGRILKGLVDGKANSSHTHSWSLISETPATATRWPSWGEVTGKPGSFTPSSHTHDWSLVTGKPELKNWSDTKAYIDNKFSSASGIKRIINIDFISTRAPELIYDYTDNNFRLSSAIREWNGGAIFCTVYKKKIYYGFPYMYNHDSNHPQWIKNAFSDKSYATIDPRGEFYHGVVDSNTILNLHGTFYNADLLKCDSNGNVLA